jgi:hypothetical protein
MHCLGCIALGLVAAVLALPCASIGFTGVAALAGGLFVMSMVGE